MGRSFRFFKSSIGKKMSLGISGLLLCGFLISHLLGNLIILCSQEGFNRYGHALITNPFIVPMELGLMGLFLYHIVMAFYLTYENKRARPEPYRLKVKTGRGATFASSTMPYTGLIVLLFLILHLLHFRFGPQYEVTYEDGVVMRDLSRLVIETFLSPGMVLYYIFSIVALGIHVSHGFASAFQSLGLNHPRYTPTIKKLSNLYALVITLGFISIPVIIFFKEGASL